MISSENYHLHYDGKQRGPYTLDQIRHMFVNGLIPPEAMYLREGMDQWHPVEELFRSPLTPKRRNVKATLGIALVVLLAAVVTWDLLDPWIEEVWRSSGLGAWVRKFVYIWFFRST